MFFDILCYKVNYEYINNIFQSNLLLWDKYESSLSYANLPSKVLLACSYSVMNFFMQNVQDLCEVKIGNSKDDIFFAKIF